MSLILWGWTVTFVTGSSDLFMQMVHESDMLARRSSYLIQRMAQQFTAQRQRNLSNYNKS